MPSVVLNERSSVGDWVADRPSRARVLERLGIDYCCGGQQPLSEACTSRGLEVAAVLRQMDAVEPAPEDRDWRVAGLAELCGHIVDTHHAYVRGELPRIHSLIAKVVAAHGSRHGELASLQAVFEGLEDELMSHLMKEEQILFPMIGRIESAPGPQAFHCGTIANPIRVMLAEHDSAGVALAEMRRRTGDYTAPADACPTWRAMNDALVKFEADLHSHIHKENNILFPRARALQDERGNL